MIYVYTILSQDNNQILFKDIVRLMVINRHQENKNCTDNVFDIL